jgi:hypothetical protein
LQASLGLDFIANFYHMFLMNRIRKQYLIWNGGAGNNSVGTVTRLWNGQPYNWNSIPGRARDFFFSLHRIQPLLGSAKPPMKQVPNRGHPRGYQIGVILGGKRAGASKLTNHLHVGPRCIINCRDNVTFTL